MDRRGHRLEQAECLGVAEGFDAAQGLGEACLQPCLNFQTEAARLGAARDRSRRARNPGVSRILTGSLFLSVSPFGGLPRPAIVPLLPLDDPRRWIGIRL